MLDARVTIRAIAPISRPASTPRPSPRASIARSRRQLRRHARPGRRGRRSGARRSQRRGLSEPDAARSRRGPPPRRRTAGTRSAAGSRPTTAESHTVRPRSRRHAAARERHERSRLGLQRFAGELPRSLPATALARRTRGSVPSGGRLPRRPVPDFRRRRTDPNSVANGLQQRVVDRRDVFAAAAGTHGLDRAETGRGGDGNDGGSGARAAGRARVLGFTRFWAAADAPDDGRRRRRAARRRLRDPVRARRAAPLPARQRRGLHGRDRCHGLHARDAPRVRRRPHLGDRQHDAQADVRGQAAAERRLLVLARALDDRLRARVPALDRDQVARRAGQERQLGPAPGDRAGSGRSSRARSCT